MKRENLNTKDLELLLLIRHFEQSLLDLFSKGKLNGTVHTCIGQEYIPVALREFLNEEDFVFSNHRGHGHYLAKFEDPKGLLAEVMGKASAVCHGVGGSQHIYRDHYLSTGVQGESISASLGVTLHFKRKGDNQIAVVHIGDGTWGQGVVYESLNIAQLWQLPLLVIVENNHIAQSTPAELNMAGTIEDRVKAFGMKYEFVESTDICEIREKVQPLIEDVRQKSVPCVIEFHTYRLAPHSKGDDTRDEKELEQLKKNDWYIQYKNENSKAFEKTEKLVSKKINTLIDELDRESLSDAKSIVR